jgi:hypothetical protein
MQHPPNPRPGPSSAVLVRLGRRQRQRESDADGLICRLAGLAGAWAGASSFFQFAHLLARNDASSMVFV